MSISVTPFANAAQQGAGGGGVVTLSGATVNAFAFMNQATAEIFLQVSGIVQRRTNFGSFVQLSSGTDWVIPNGDAPGSFRARHTNLSGDALAFASAAINTYLAFSVSLYVCRQLDNTPFAGGTDTTFTFEIDDGSVSQDTGIYRLIADREDF